MIYFLVEVENESGRVVGGPYLSETIAKELNYDIDAVSVEPYSAVGGPDQLTPKLNDDLRILRKGGEYGAMVTKCLGNSLAVDKMRFKNCYYRAQCIASLIFSAEMACKGGPGSLATHVEQKKGPAWYWLDSLKTALCVTKSRMEYLEKENRGLRRTVSGLCFGFDYHG